MRWALIQYECILTKGKFRPRDRHTEREDDVKTQQTCHPQAKECLKLPEERGEKCGRLSLRPQKDQLSQQCDCGLLVSRTVRTVCFSHHPVCGTLLQQPRETGRESYASGGLGSGNGGDTHFGSRAHKRHVQPCDWRKSRR